MEVEPGICGEILRGKDEPIGRRLCSGSSSLALLDGWSILRSSGGAGWDLGLLVVIRRGEVAAATEEEEEEAEMNHHHRTTTIHPENRRHPHHLHPLLGAHEE